MRTIRLSLALLGAAFLGALAGCESLDTDDSGTHVLDLAGRVTVLVVDNSGGPEEFDPRANTIEGAKFLFSTFSEADNVGIVTVRFPVAALFKISYLGEEGNREKGMAALDSLKVGGDAEYYEALKKARELLDVFSATKDSSIVFLTGGRKKPTGNPQDLRDLMKTFADRGWRFFPVVLMPAPDLLGVLEEGAALTQGAVFKIERPADIMPSLVTVAGKINDLWVRRRLAEAPIHEGAKRLLVAVARDEESADLESVTRDGASVPIAPEPGGPSGASSEAFALVTLPNPAPGKWAAKAAGAPTAQALLVKPPCEVLLDPDATVKGSALEGDEISFTLVVKMAKEALDAWGAASAADLTLVSEGTGKAVDHVSLEKTFEASELRFSGKTRLFVSEAGVPEIFTARLTLVFGEGEGSWVREEFLSFEVKPAAALKFRVDPSEVDLGVRWWDEKEIMRNVEVVARVDEPVSVAAEAPEGLVVDPASVEAAKGRNGVFRVGIGDPLRERGGENSLVFKVKGTSAAPEGPTFERSVKVSWRLLRFTGPSSVPVGPLAPGQEVEIPLQSWSVDGGAIAIGVSCEPLEGPGLLAVSIVEAEGKTALKIAVPENAELGTYSGRIVVAPRESGLANRFIPLTVEVAAPGETAAPDEGAAPSLSVDPTELSLETASTGWVHAALKVAAALDRPPVVVAGIRKVSLRGRGKFAVLSSEFDVEVEPVSGWTGKELESGRQAGFDLSFYVSPDLPDDVYEAEMALQYRAGGEDTLREIPVKVVLAVKRAK
jgi:hypothetical protein